MPMKPEAALYRRLKENLPNCHFTRIESRVGLGIPDCLLAFPHGSLTLLELKVVKRGLRVNLSPHQVAFHLKHSDLRCLTWIVVQYIPPSGFVRESQLLLYRNDQVVELKRLGVALEPVARWPWNAVMWDMVRYTLLTGESGVR